MSLQDTAAAALVPPEPVLADSSERAFFEIVPAARDLQEIERHVSEALEILFAAPLHSAVFNRQSSMLATLGEKQSHEAYSFSRDLSRILSTLELDFELDAGLARGCVEMQHIFATHHPDLQRWGSGKKSFLQRPLHGLYLRSYLQHFLDAQAQLESLTKRFYRMRDDSLRECQSFDRQERRVTGILHLLRHYIEFSNRLSLAVDERLGEERQNDAERAAHLRAEILTITFQRRTALMSAMQILDHSIRVLAFLKKFELERIRAIELAVSSTHAVYRIASALAHPAPRKPLETPAATAPEIALQQLRAAFVRSEAAFDLIDAFLTNARANLHATRENLEQERSKIRE